MSYSTVLLDLDHTLLDSDASEASAFDVTLTNAGVRNPESHFPAYDCINKNLWAAVERGEMTPDEVKVRRFEQLCDEIGIEAQPEEMAAIFVEGLANEGELYPGTRDVLEELAAITRLAMITNGLSYVQRTRIERLQLGPYLAAVAISAEIGAAKPHTQIFDVIFEALGQPDRRSVLIVGDSLSSDMQGGWNYGIDTCWFNPAGTYNDRPDVVTHEITTLGELVAIVT